MVAVLTNCDKNSCTHGRANSGEDERPPHQHTAHTDARARHVPHGPAAPPCGAQAQTNVSVRLTASALSSSAAPKSSTQLLPSESCAQQRSRGGGGCGGTGWGLAGGACVAHQPQHTHTVALLAATALPRPPPSPRAPWERAAGPPADHLQPAVDRKRLRKLGRAPIADGVAAQIELRPDEQQPRCEGGGGIRAALALPSRTLIPQPMCAARRCRPPSGCGWPRGPSQAPQHPHRRCS